MIINSYLGFCVSVENEMYRQGYIIKICWLLVNPEEKHGLVFFSPTVTCLYYHTHRLAHFLGIPWSRLLCTVIGPCGCHAVARPRPCCVVIGVCGIAAWQRRRDWQFWPPALPWLPSWWRGGEEVAQVWYGGWRLCLSLGVWGGALAKCVMADHKADSTGPGWWHLVSPLSCNWYVTCPECDHQSSLVYPHLWFEHVEWCWMLF